ncbi:MAG: hypothetical protein EAX95_10805 [Candidatus Thorarchaeota archaeon]|nr:hypothetical protein [Candidatus Thorarchaeota archaeon]
MTFYYGSPAVHIIVFLPTPAFFVYHILGLSMIYLGIAIVMRQIGKPGKDVLFRILLPTMLPWPVLGFDISLGWALDVPHLVPYGIFMWYHMLCFFQLILFILSILFTLGEFFRERNSSTQQ